MHEAECGICSVIVDGTPVNSCVFPAFKAQGATIETIEGLSQDGELHPLQQAFLDHGAVQCGICTPGVLMSLSEYLQRNPDPTEDEVKMALSGNICRCTGYHEIVQAAMDAAKALREGA